MAKKVSITITMKDNNSKTVTDKVSYVNPEATDTELTDFAKMLVAMTNNTYTATTKITEEDL